MRELQLSLLKGKGREEDMARRSEDTPPQTHTSFCRHPPGKGLVTLTTCTNTALFQRLSLFERMNGLWLGASLTFVDMLSSLQLARYSKELALKGGARNISPTRSPGNVMQLCILHTKPALHPVLCAQNMML